MEPAGLPVDIPELVVPPAIVNTTGSPPGPPEPSSTSSFPLLLLSILLNHHNHNSRAPAYLFTHQLSRFPEHSLSIFGLGLPDSGIQYHKSVSPGNCTEDSTSSVPLHTRFAVGRTIPTGHCAAQLQTRRSSTLAAVDIVWVAGRHSCRPNPRLQTFHPQPQRKENTRGGEGARPRAR